MEMYEKNESSINYYHCNTKSTQALRIHMLLTFAFHKWNYFN